MPAPLKITFRVSHETHAKASVLARERGYVTEGGQTNLSRLMRALIKESYERRTAHETHEEEP